MNLYSKTKRHIIRLGFLWTLCTFTLHVAQAQNKDAQNRWVGFVEQLNFRSIGPAVTSGRISDIAVNPNNPKEYYVAAAYGGVWKTQNAGITFTPIFDHYETQSIGCLAIDPNNTNIIWVGTGENNNQRSVGYGNGIYKSEDGGKSFKNMGLKHSFHIGTIVVNPKKSDEIWVAAYGPLWGDKGEKGIYTSKDGGKTWIVSLTDDKAGFNEVHLDPFNENIIYACAHQRRRHEWTYLGGGPNSAIYKSTDKGVSWQKLSKGLPTEDKGRITMSVSQQHPGKLTAVIETSKTAGGVFISNDYGASWQKVNDYFSSGNYYQEVFQDPKNDQRLFFMDTYLHVSEDGGKTVKRFPEKNKHVDNHAIWIDPVDYRHLLVGCDGGLYETFDYGENWSFNENLPITQFYRVAVDNSKPFYSVYGGTQDNYSLGGPSRNNTANGIPNEDWFVTVGGDGFKSQVDPKNPNIVYSQWQYGGLVRFDKNTGDQIDIKPKSIPNEPPLIWNWDAPLLISKYNNKKIYFAANRLFKSENRGDSWSIISPVLGRKLDRNQLPVMDKIWGLDAVAKNQSTSIYGNISAITEGKMGELLVGTDDGMLYFSQNDGLNWDSLSLPMELNGLSLKYGNSTLNIMPFITSLQIASDGTFYVAYDNHRQGDFKPYVFRSQDKGKKWKLCTTGIPDYYPVKTIWSDPVDADILCIGTEFGLFISSNKGDNNTKFAVNLPPIAIKDIVYQEESQDLILATFGRGIVICDDYHLIRELKKNQSKWVNESIHHYFLPYEKVGGKGNGFRGANRFQGVNLDEEFRFYVFIDEIPLSLKEQRKEIELKRDYFPHETLIIKEHEERLGQFYIQARSIEGQVVSVFKVSLKKGWNALKWNLKYSIKPSHLHSTESEIQYGPYINPGNYLLTLFKLDSQGLREVSTDLKMNTPVTISHLFEDSELISFSKERLERWNRIKSVKSELQRVTLKLEEIHKSISKIMDLSPVFMNKSIDFSELLGLRKKLLDIRYVLLGGNPLANYEFPVNESIQSELFTVFSYMKESLQAPTISHVNKVIEIETKLLELRAQLEGIEARYKQIESTLE
jgi:photosystem II stability/assembly factor-like uncharacterized protein